MRLADPGSAWSTVTPPAIASGICGSWGQKLCSAQTCAVTGLVASLPSLSAKVPGAEYTPIWLWVSMRPGVTNFPVPSITVASGGGVRLAPSATIFPSRRRMAAPGSSGPAAVMIVALRMKTGAFGCR